MSNTYSLTLFFVFFATASNAIFADEAAVRKMIDDYADAYNKHDLEAVKAFWTEDSLHVDRDTGARTDGRAAIVSDIEVAFEQSPDLKLSGYVKHLRLVKPDVAYVEGEARIISPEFEPSIFIFTAVLVNQEGKWKIHSIEETPIPLPASSYEALQELEPLIGHWVDESSESEVHTIFRWIDNRSFLLRSFSVETAAGELEQGTQIIGWDPRSQEIRSWSFNSDGSFGDGIWSKNGKDWLVKSSQTLPDGLAASGTYVITPVDTDTLSMQLIGHEIEGEPQPTRQAVTVVRVPDAAPSTSSSSPSVQQ